MRRGASVCCGSGFVVPSSPEVYWQYNFRKNGLLNLVSVLVLRTCQNSFCLNNSLHVSVIGISVAPVGLCCSSHDTISARGSSVPRGPCFCCGASYGLFVLYFPWCVVFTSLYLFGARDLFFSWPGIHLSWECQYVLATDCYE